MKEKAAKVEILGAPTRVRPGDEVSVDVKVTNLTGHKLPTGFAEGRQMWIHLPAKDKNGKVVWEDGKLATGGALERTEQTKVYEQEILAEGYDFIDQQAKDLLIRKMFQPTAFSAGKPPTKPVEGAKFAPD